MADRSLLHPAERDLLEQVERLLADPAEQDNSLRAALAALFAYSELQRERLERVVRISDGYQHVTRGEKQSLVDQYDRQLRRLEKLARISDRYQNSLREMSEALRDAALHDTLTGLGNRRFLMERLKDETERASRKGQLYAVGILDVDHFKLINDRFGHEAGDQALCLIANAIKDALREYDQCGRWGGEEFLIILPDTSLEFAVQVAERVRLAIRNTGFDFIEGGGGVTASIGITIYQPGEPYSAAVNRADSALLQAKELGRDRVAAAS
ncbi:biofilm regulation diguanylate cyclase SiaD [Quatrionicoccus australiensis]|uniref:biofilm regulation diguanylate cyclase SiaD n=1 Tax=Quatrionicoccus australiensis TaxID=138118 RepID=UPI001CF81E7F|nr:biofilm regulation diguanylate cyclase SiaD [Quatrionicoccus australiensis]UCV15392.1 biofilm regulation diguanylate cyclase SiaD [Quatrionicoccus australiensis]